MSKLFIVSGGSGSSGEQLVYTVAAQFPAGAIEVETIPHIRQEDQVLEVVKRAWKENALIVHTMVNTEMRHVLEDACIDAGVISIDLMGTLIERLSVFLESEPLGQPGLFRRLHKEYFERISAIEFAIAHDDGQRPEDLSSADIVLLGVSRVGKTPLCIYLSVLGWKVANVPVIKDIPLPGELVEVDRKRVIGLTINPEKLINHRKSRRLRLETKKLDSYSDPGLVSSEIEETVSMFRQNGYTILDVTDRPIETSADEIARIITSRFGSNGLERRI